MTRQLQREMVGCNVSSVLKRGKERGMGTGEDGMGCQGQERETSLLHSVVFHMGGKVHTVRFVRLHVHGCALGGKKEQ